MAFLGILVPQNVGNLLSQIDIPGEKSSIDEMHITLMYFEKLSNQDAIKAIDAIHSVVSETAPFTVSTDHVSHFPGWENNDKCAVITKVESKDLHTFRQKLADALEENEVEFSKTYKTYKPHITLSYAKKEPKDFSFPEVDFTVSEIILWCGEEMNDKLVVKFPFSLDKNAHLFDVIDRFYKLAYTSIFNLSKQQALRELELSNQLEPELLKKHMKKMVGKHHPDHGGSHNRIKRIIDAYNVLKNEPVNSINPNDWSQIPFSPIAPPSPPPVYIRPQDIKAPAPGMGRKPTAEEIDTLKQKYEKNPKPWGDWSK